MAARKESAQDLLLEIGCEDLPARYVQPLAESLGHVAEALAARGVPGSATRLFATPRRIAVRVERVAAQQAPRSVERRGPKLAAALKDGAPTAAGLGFAKSCGVPFSALAQEGDQLVFRSVEPGRRTVELLPEIFGETLKAMDGLVPKRMRWGAGDETFVRPVQWLLCLFGGKVVPLQRFGLKAGNRTYGHRFHAPRAIVLKSPTEYERKLKAAKVWADFASRREEIARQIEAESKKLKGRIQPNVALLDEVTALVEWPVAIHGRIEARFLELPPEVVVATIEHNQRYFPVRSASGALLPAFVTVANIKSRDATQVVLGNERVVRPRLADAMFFWNQDQKSPLESRIKTLDQVTFHQKLGSVGDKVRRISAISGEIAAKIGEDPRTVRRAAELCKADLVSRMVFEFPELQGIMGGYYAKSSGETDAVAAAIREHYQPTVSGGPLPRTRPGQVVALADKLDTLAGVFAAGQKPSAGKDPFGLRRAALGVLRVLIECGLDLDLRALLDHAVRLQPGVKAADALVDELLQFHWDRLRAYYLEAGFAVEMFEAVIATGESRPLDLHRRIRAVRDFLRLPEAEKLAAAHKRVRNILRQAQERQEPISAGVDRALAEPKEAALLDAMSRVGEAHAGILLHRGEVALDEAGLAEARYLKALKALAGLQAPVDRFFDSVMVMAQDPAVRANRLALLRQLDDLCRAAADISCLPG